MQLTSDGHAAYLEAAEGASAAGVDFAQLVKLYGTVPDAAKGRYSSAECVAARKTPIEGDPDEKHISTSYVERMNLGIRMGNRRLVLR